MTRAADDSELSRAAQTGSADAFAQLVERHEVPLFRFLRLRTGRADLAEELVQDTFVRCWTKLHLFDGTRAFRPWLFRIAANVLHNRRRDQPTTLPLAEMADARDPQALAAAREAHDNLWEFAQRVLPRESCSALWLFHAEGMPAAEVAGILGRSEGAVRTLLSRARSRLARLLRWADDFLEVR